MSEGLLSVATLFPHLAWIIGVFFVVISPVTIIGNGLVLASIVRDPFRNIRRAPCSYAIFNLALADFLVGTLEPFAAVYTFYLLLQHTDLFLVKVISAGAYTLHGVSLSTLVVLSIDRFIAIKTPLQYACRVTKKKIRNAIVLVWFYFTFIGIGPMVYYRFHASNSVVKVIFAVHAIAGIVALFALNIAVVRSVCIQGNSIKGRVDSRNDNVLQNALNREKAVTRTTGIMAAAFLVSMMPYILFSLLSFHFENTNEKKFKGILTCLYFVGVCMGYLNSLMNPFIFAWRLPKYRKSFCFVANVIKNKMSFSHWQSDSVRSYSCEEQNKSEHKKRHDKPSNYITLFSGSVPGTKTARIGQ